MSKLIFSKVNWYKEMDSKTVLEASAVFKNIQAGTEYNISITTEFMHLDKRNNILSAKEEINCYSSKFVF